MRIETVAVHAGRHVDSATGAVALPIHLATTFERDADGGYSRGHLYARNSNPTREALETCLRDLEGGAAAAAFASGTAATAAVFQSLVPGDHVIAPLDAYHGTLRQIREAMAPVAAMMLVGRTNTGRPASSARANRVAGLKLRSTPLA